MPITEMHALEIAIIDKAGQQMLIKLKFGQKWKLKFVKMRTIFPLALIVGYNYVLFMAGFSITDAEKEMNFHSEAGALQRGEQTGVLWLGFPLRHSSRATAKRAAGSPRQGLNGCSSVCSLPACSWLW